MTTSSHTLEDLTLQERYVAAWLDLRRAGVKARRNLKKCCRGCVEPKDLSTTQEALDAGQPYVFHFGGQGMNISFTPDGQQAYRPNHTYHSRDKFPESVMLNHGNGGAEKAVEAFRANGFEVVWDGDQSSCVEVKF